MNIEKKIEEILQKHGVATKMIITTGSTNNPISTWYTQKVAIELIKELSQLLQESEKEAVRGFGSWLDKDCGQAMAFSAKYEAEQYLKENK